jgi:hypothetical protein
MFPCFSARNFSTGAVEETPTTFSVEANAPACAKNDTGMNIWNVRRIFVQKECANTYICAAVKIANNNTTIWYRICCQMLRLAIFINLTGRVLIRNYFCLFITEAEANFLNLEF